MAPSKGQEDACGRATKVLFAAIALVLAAFTFVVYEPVSGKTTEARAYWGTRPSSRWRERRVQWFGCRRLCHSNQSKHAGPKKNKVELIWLFQKDQTAWMPNYVGERSSKSRRRFENTYKVSSRSRLKKLRPSIMLQGQFWPNSSSRRAIFSEFKN